MTLVLSLIHPGAIIMAADSRRTQYSTPVDFETFQPLGAAEVRYSETTKLFVVPGVGCVTMWGDITRAEARIGPYLQSVTSFLSGPEDLADKLLQFLKSELQAEGGDELGFHVGGYNPNGERKLFHVFWGADVGPEVDPANNPPDYKKYDHSLDWVALYNGKHAIADGIIRFLLALQAEVGIVNWITNFPPSRSVRFADFVIRYAASIDPTVGGAVHVAAVLPGNSILLATNRSAGPIPPGVIEDQLVHHGAA